jgi:group II intron reverse transcriptase/maturase
MAKGQSAKAGQSVADDSVAQGRCHSVQICEGREMRTAHTILELLRQRGQRRLPLQRVYRLLYRPDLYLMAYGKIYRNKGAMTKGVTEETVDAMSLEKIRAIIDALRHERYRWHPARRTYIPRKDGKQRPLGVQTWSDKLLQEVIRLILSAYLEPQFSEQSHGFRPGRGCHTALQEIHRHWVGTAWFIEGDIAKCFDRLDHGILLARLRQYIQDERFLRLIGHLLKAGYLEAWTWHATYSGAPQGSILSPLLSNLYLDALDSFVESTLIPEYTRGTRRRFNPAYEQLRHRASYLQRTGRLQEARQVRRQVQRLPSIVPDDPDYRRLRFCRYADDFLLGFVGPKQEAEAIKRRLSAFLQQDLKLELSEAKTLITHARTEFAHFLGYDIHVFQENSRHDRFHRRSLNGGIGLRVPRAVVDERCRRYPHRRGKVLQRTELINDTEFSIIARYQAEFRGLVEYYRLAYNLHTLTRLDHVMETSLTKTLAAKLRLSVPQVYRRFQTVIETKGRKYKGLQVVIERPNKKPLIAQWGGIPLTWDMQATLVDALPPRWVGRSELEKRLLAQVCEYCGTTSQEEPIQVHHIRALKDLLGKTGRDKPDWVKIMAARQRKTLVLCVTCHQDVTHGRPMRRSPKSVAETMALESRMS